MNLSELNEGSYAKVIDISVKGNMKRRLQDLGLIRGTVIKCVNRSPHGDPTAYRIRGAVIALRKDDTSLISVSDGDILWD